VTGQVEEEEEAVAFPVLMMGRNVQEEKLKKTNNRDNRLGTTADKSIAWEVRKNKVAFVVVVVVVAEEEEKNNDADAGVDKKTMVAGRRTGLATEKKKTVIRYVVEDDEGC